jgi:dihydropyrimidinase
LSSPRFDLLVSGGTVVSAESAEFRADVGIRDGRIAAFLDPGADVTADERLDATDRVVMPGLIDAHVHPGVYRPIAEDLDDLTGFGLRGGITSIIAIHRRPLGYDELIPEAIATFSAASRTDFGLIIGITSTEHIESVAAADAHGIGAFKFYLGYRGNESRFGSDFEFSDDRLAEIMAALAALRSDVLLAVHCENAELARYFRARAAASDLDGLRLYDAASDAASEADAVARVTLLGSRFDLRIGVLHVSAGSTAELIATAPWVRRDRVTVETCPHYLALDVDDPAGLRAIVRPPIRSRSEVERLWRQLEAGAIDTIGSDHCATDLEAKADMPVWECPLGFGDGGLTLPILLTEGYHKRGLSLRRIAAITSANVARAHRIHPRKGTLQLGSDADLVVVDLDRERVLDPDVLVRLKGRTDGSIYAGRSIRGWPTATVRAGRIACVDDELLPDQAPVAFLPGTGQSIG